MMDGWDPEAPFSKTNNALHQDRWGRYPRRREGAFLCVCVCACVRWRVWLLVSSSLRWCVGVLVSVMSSAVSEKGLQEGDVNALCARIASSEAEGSNGSQQLHGVTASDAMDILLQRFLDLGQGGIPQVSDKMVGFFELEGWSSLLLLS